MEIELWKIIVGLAGAVAAAIVAIARKPTVTVQNFQGPPDGAKLVYSTAHNQVSADLDNTLDEIEGINEKKNGRLQGLADLAKRDQQR